MPRDDRGSQPRPLPGVLSRCRAFEPRQAQFDGVAEMMFGVLHGAGPAPLRREPEALPAERARLGARAPRPLPGMLLGFDADDTLWHNETVFESAHARFAAILARWHPRDTVERTLYATEMRNLPLYGYGVKGFALSVLETALELAGDELRPAEVRQILALARSMLEHPVDLLDGVAETLDILARGHRLALVTKGDLRHQTSKIERSGLRRHFSRVEIVADKSPSVYRSLLEAWGVPPEDFVMVGNSLRSDVFPVLEIGGVAVWVPYPLTWQHEQATPPPADCARFHTVASIRELPGLLCTLRR